MMRVFNILTLIFLFFGIVVMLRYGYDKLEIYNSTNLLLPSNTKPYLHTGDFVPRIEFHTGDVAFMHVETMRPLTCTAEVSLRIIAEELLPDGGVHRTIYETFGNNRTSAPTGHYISDTRFAIPAYLNKGEYIVERAAFFSCKSFNVDKTTRSIFKVV